MHIFNKLFLPLLINFWTKTKHDWKADKLNVWKMQKNEKKIATFFGNIQISPKSGWLQKASEVASKGV